MSAPTYQPERTALPSGHLAGLRLGVRLRAFCDAFDAFRNTWREEFQLWLVAHDTGEPTTVTHDGQVLPMSQVEFTPEGIYQILNAQNNGGEGGDGGEGGQG